MEGNLDTHASSLRAAKPSLLPCPPYAPPSTLSRDRTRIPVTTFPIKKRIDAELFIERNKWLYIQKGDVELMGKETF